MSDQPILPIDPMFSKEVFLRDRAVKTNIIYIIVIILIITVISLLPVIKVAVSVQSSGIIRPTSEKAIIKAPCSEIVSRVYIKEGVKVNQGDTLITFRKDIIQSKIQFLQSEYEKTKLYIEDLETLTKGENIMPKSGLYAQQYILFKRKISDVNLRIEKARKEYERHKPLFNNQLISIKEYDNITFDLAILEKEKDILLSTQISEWKANLANNNSNLENIQNQINQSIKEQDFYNITSPISGTIEEFAGIYPGSSLQVGQTITVISPKSNIIAELYVSAKDIGYINNGQKATIQVDAFNYNEWGTIEATVISVSDDFILINNTPVFKVKCRLERQYLKLNNRVKGSLKKGMTVTARFLVAQRSLFQLLYQKSDDWLNPSRNSTSTGK